MKQRNTNRRDGFTFYNSIYKTTKKLNDKQLAIFMKEFLSVQFLEKKLEDVNFTDPILDIMWSGLINTVETQVAGYLVNKGKSPNQFMGIHDENYTPSDGGCNGGSDDPSNQIVRVRVNSKSKSKKTEDKFSKFIKELKELVKIKSKVTSTVQGKELFKDIKNIDKLKTDYIAHQAKEGKFSQRITAYMEDYNTTTQTPDLPYGAGYHNGKIRYV